MATEFEVYNSYLEPFLGALIFVSEEDAEKVSTKLIKVSGMNWFVRKVEAGKRPIPPKASVPTPVTVDEARRLMATHGQDIVVTVAWSAEKGEVNITTSGSSEVYANQALKLGQDIAVIAGCDPKEMTTYEDRRSEHKVSSAGSAQEHPA